MLSWIFIVLAHWNNSPQVNMSLHSHTLFWFWADQSFALSSQCCMLSGEATNTNFIVFGMTRPGLEPTIYRTQGEHANHYATDAVAWLEVCKYIYILTIIPYTQWKKTEVRIHNVMNETFPKRICIVFLHCICITVGDPIIQGCIFVHVHPLFYFQWFEVRGDCYTL